MNFECPYFNIPCSLFDIPCSSEVPSRFVPPVAGLQTSTYPPQADSYQLILIKKGGISDFS